jgi:hypothetical protein
MKKNTRERERQRETETERDRDRERQREKTIFVLVCFVEAFVDELSGCLLPLPNDVL